MRRIMIVGGPGAGKTTLALVLGQCMRLPVHHMDRLFWQPGWRPALPEARTAAIAEVLDTSTYILEGAYAVTYPARLADCDTLIWLDVNPLVRAVRLWWRLRSEAGQHRPDLAEGCLEGDPDHGRSLWRVFWADPFRLHEQQLWQVAVAEGRVRTVRLRSRREVSAFVAELAPEHVRSKLPDVGISLG
jgi:adenylate kinase family enzyme